MNRLARFQPLLAAWRHQVRRGRLARAATSALTRVRARLAPTGAPVWLQWCRAFDARTQRERILLIVAAVAVLLALLDAIWFDPLRRDWSQARQATNQTREAVERLRSDGDALEQRGLEERRLLEAELQRLQAQYAGMTPPPPTPGHGRRAAAGPDTRRSAGGLVPASEMLPLLGQLLKRQPGIKVVQLASLGHTVIGTTAADVTPAAGAASKPAGARPAARIYRHGVELVIQGGYTDLVEYLQAVEALPQRLLWGSLRLSVEEHPRSQLTLRLYTLSLDARWLEI